MFGRLYGLFYIAVFLFFSINISLGGCEVHYHEDDENHSKFNSHSINFASHTSGAVVLDKSPPSAKGYSNLLNDDKVSLNILFFGLMYSKLGL